MMIGNDTCNMQLLNSLETEDVVSEVVWVGFLSLPLAVLKDSAAQQSGHCCLVLLFMMCQTTSEEGWSVGQSSTDTICFKSHFYKKKKKKCKKFVRWTLYSINKWNSLGNEAEFTMHTEFNILDFADRYYCLHRSHHHSRIRHSWGQCMSAKSPNI